jgi:predicted DNA-binding transcriptional regulator AlpA
MTNPNSIVPAVLDDVQAGEYVGVSASTLRKWRIRGVGPRWCKLGRMVRYRIADLDDWLIENVRG